MNRSLRGIVRLLLPPLIAAAASAGPALAEDAAEAEALLNAKCASCHERQPGGGLSRIAEQRKTPEGWLMTLTRMRLWHGVQLSDGERQTLLRHLADRQGLAPEESAPFRYVLERRRGQVEAPDDADLATFCARCHSYARVGLQRRDAKDWRKLVHMHLGQWPTIEYQAMSRDRRWWEQAREEIPKRLGEKWPWRTDAWAAWSKRSPADLAGSWRIAGHQPGKGAYAGRMQVERAADGYRVTYALSYSGGDTVAAQGGAVVYTGYEWRGTLSTPAGAVRQVLAASADGKRMAGRWFMAEEDAIGADMVAVREGAGAVLAVEPPYLKPGQTARLTVVGTGMTGKLDLGPGVEVVRTVAETSEERVVEVRVAADAAAGPCSVTVGKASVPLMIYDRVDSVRVEPPLDVARVGGAGGPVAALPSQFQAVGYMNGPDGKPGTADDMRIGVMPAAWSLSNFDHEAEKMQDARFGGALDARGLFRPAEAGMNPERGPLLNNFANLKVTATVTDGAAPVEGTAHLFVAPQRWNDPPIL